MPKTGTRLSLTPAELGSLGRLLFENAISTGVVIMDSVGRIEAVNPMFPKLLGYARNAEFVGKLPGFLFAGNADRNSYKKFIAELVANGRWIGMSYARRPDGSILPVNLHFSALDGARGVHHYGGICSVAFEGEGFDAGRDPLTKLMKKSAFNSRLRYILAHTEKRMSTLSVVVLDIDRFRHIVEQYDYVNSDTVIVNIANILKEVLGANEAICHLDADKFAFIVEDSYDQEELASKLQDVMETLSAPNALHDKIETVPISMGVAAYPVSGDTAEELMAAALDSVARAKKNGGMQIDFHRLFSDE